MISTGLLPPGRLGSAPGVGGKKWLGEQNHNYFGAWIFFWEREHETWELGFGIKMHFEAWKNGHRLFFSTPNERGVA